MTGRFQTEKVAQCFEEVRGWCHPQYPFRDPLYSPGGYYPAIDFTPYIARWLAEEKFDAIIELWKYIAPDFAQKWIQLFLRLSPPAWTGLPFKAVMELHAIHLLSARLGMVDNAAGYLVARLAAATLACFESRNRSLAALNCLSSPMQTESSAAERLRCVPSMTRLVVEDFFSWDRGGLGLRPELYYTERHYGCATEWNLHFVGWLGFFHAPPDSAPVPASITKKHLSDVLLERGLKKVEKMKKVEMVTEIRSVPGLMRRIFEKHSPSYVELRPEWIQPVKAWDQRFKRCEPDAGAMMEAVFLKSFKDFSA